MNKNNLIDQALSYGLLTKEEGLWLYNHVSLPELMEAAHLLRMKLHPEKEVTWLIDRNVNITNVCISNCRFCNFHCKPNDNRQYITTIKEYQSKIDELFAKGGEQLLLQGGLHPKLGLRFYEELFSSLKEYEPRLKLHALGPPEIVHIARLENMGYSDVLRKLMESGLDSLPGAGAEILTNRVRKKLSKYKCSSEEWLEVMRVAHSLGMVTSATMMFGHIETLEERFEHIEKIQQIQNLKPDKAPGFLSFIPWPFQDRGTWLREHEGIISGISGHEYIKTIAISRLMLPNVPNIQASWLTVGPKIASICLHGGANDMGSIMIEENVVSSAGASNTLDAEGMKKSILEAGFQPKMRNQRFEY